jgi:hypothetical protein
MLTFFYTHTERPTMAKGKGGGAKPAAKETSTRNNGKASKKRPKIFDAVKRRLVSKND